jgi:hypothetical protein
MICAVCKKIQMFSVKHGTYYPFTIMGILLVLSPCISTISINRRDISTHVPVLATLLTLEDYTPPIRDTESSMNLDSTTWKGLSSVKANHDKERDPIITPTPPDVPEGATVPPLKRFKIADPPWNWAKLRKSNCGSSKQGPDTKVIEFTAQIDMPNNRFHTIEDSIYRVAVARKFEIETCSVGVISVSSTDATFTTTDVITRISIPIQDVDYVMETLNNGNIWKTIPFVLDDDDISVYVSNTRIIPSSHDVRKDHAEILEWETFMFI